MSFIVQAKEQLKVDVIVEVPLDFGKTEQQKMVVTFNKPSTQDREALAEMIQSGESRHDSDVLRDSIVRIDDLKNPDGSDIDYNADVLEQVLGMEYCLSALVDAYRAITQGGEAYKKLKRKN